MSKRQNVTNKSDLVALMAAKHGMTKRDANKVVTAFFATVRESLARGERVRISGFGLFEVRTRQARIGRNPVTQEPIPMPETLAPAFRAGKTLKAAIRK